MDIVRLEKTPISLENDGTLTLFFTGVGSAFSKRHYQTNLLIVKGKDHLLIDCGTKTPQAFFELGCPITQVRNFLITHMHADHIGGLEEVMLLGRYVMKKKPVIYINETFRHFLWDLSLRGGSEYNEEHDGKNLEFGDFWDTVHPKWVQGYPRETMEINVGSINLKIFRTNHVPEQAKDWQDAFWSCGLIIDDRVMFTSDTKFDSELITGYSQIFKLEHIFHDCQFFTGGVHASIEELKTLPEAIREKIVLVHYGDNWENFEEKVLDYRFFGLALQWHYYIYPERRKAER